MISAWRVASGLGCLTTGFGGGASFTFTGASLLAICEWNRSRTSRISFITLMSCESSSGDCLFVPPRQELGWQITTWSKARIEIVPASLSDDSVLYGAMGLAQGLTHLK